MHPKVVPIAESYSGSKITHINLFSPHSFTFYPISPVLHDYVKTVSFPTTNVSYSEKIARIVLSMSNNPQNRLFTLL